MSTVFTTAVGMTSTLAALGVVGSGTYHNSAATDIPVASDFQKLDQSDALR